MLVKLKTLWWIELIGWILIGLEYFFPQKLLDNANARLIEHSNCVQKRIENDLLKEFEDVLRRFHVFLCGLFCIVYCVVVLSAAPIIRGYSVYVDSVAPLSVVVVAFIGIFLFRRVIRAIASLVFFSPVYSFFLFVSKCPKGALAAYGVAFQVVAIILRRPQ